MGLPNILLFITDQQRADHVGCYGNPIVKTPNIDKLAARGIAFDRFYVASPICMTNRAALMTGRLPSLGGVRSNGIPLSFRYATFVELLRERGYRTAMIGKSHIQNMLDVPAFVEREQAPGLVSVSGFEEAIKDRLEGEEYAQEMESRWRDPGHKVRVPYYGFDHVELCDGHGDMAFGDYTWWLKAREPEAEKLVGRENAIPDERYICPQAWRTRLPEELYPTSYIAERTIAYLEQHAKSGTQAPFFVKCSFPDPHHPFTPPGRYWHMYDPQQIPVPPTCKQPPDDAHPIVKWLHEERATGKANVNTPRVIAVNEREAREAIALNYAMITMIDDAIGRILEALHANGLGENTVAIFTSDHGDLMGDHGLLFKNPLHYQALLRVVFIWVEPGQRKGFRCDDLFGTLDIAQTILHRTGTAPYNGIQGKSMLDVIDQKPGAAGHDGILIEEEGQRTLGVLGRPVRCRSLVTKRWRITFYLGMAWGDLYDLDKDPHETRNLWADQQYASVRAEMTERLLRKMLESCDRSPLPTRLA